jgi:hypothetical protein
MQKRKGRGESFKSCVALPTKKRIESVKRHRQWQDQLQREQFFDSVFGARARRGVRK